MMGDDPHTCEATVEDQLGLVACGQVDSFRALYDSTSELVFRAVWLVVRDVGQTEEVVQEVFLEIWRKAATFDRGRGTAKSWLRSLAHSRAVDRVRRAQTSKRSEDRWARLNSGTPVDHVIEEIIRQDEHRTVASLMRVLTSVQQEAVRLVFFTGLSYPEASRIAGVPLSTFKARIQSALRTLREDAA